MELSNERISIIVETLLMDEHEHLNLSDILKFVTDLDNNAGKHLKGELK